MTKSDIVNDIINKTGHDKTKVAPIVEAFMKTIKDSMCSGENVYLRGLGSFIVVKRAEKTGRDILNNKPIIIPEHFHPKFKPAKEFLEEVKNKVIAIG